MDSIWWLVIAFVVGVNFGAVFMAMLQLSSGRRREEAKRRRALHGLPVETPSTF